MLSAVPPTTTVAITNNIYGGPVAGAALNIIETITIEANAVHKPEIAKEIIFVRTIGNPLSFVVTSEFPIA
ncbi:hypothetical protein ES708_35008 [subsurface metagenome]